MKNKDILFMFQQHANRPESWLAKTGYLDRALVIIKRVIEVEGRNPEGEWTFITNPQLQQEWNNL